MPIFLAWGRGSVRAVLCMSLIALQQRILAERAAVLTELGMDRPPSGRSTGRVSRELAQLQAFNDKSSSYFQDPKGPRLGGSKRGAPAPLPHPSSVGEVRAQRGPFFLQS